MSLSKFPVKRTFIDLDAHTSPGSKSGKIFHSLSELSVTQ